jgi:hypothetical protein
MQLILKSQIPLAFNNVYHLHMNRLTAKNSSAKNNYSQQWDFWQGAAKMSNRSVLSIHEDCELSGNVVKNSSAKSIEEK